jgi:hypothetical protein
MDHNTFVAVFGGGSKSGVRLGPELVTNGDMELNSDWTAYNTEGPETVEQSSEQAHGGTYSWKVFCDAGNEGVKSAVIAVDGSSTYKLSAWFYVPTTCNVRIVTNNSSRLNIDEIFEVAAGSWVNKIIDGVSSSAGNIELRFFTNNSPYQFYLDDVSLKVYL